MKEARQSVILRIINEEAIETQEQLIAALNRAGIRTTQATLSRDIKEMHIVKHCGANGKYRYGIAGDPRARGLDPTLQRIFQQSVVSFDCAGSILVIKTMAGLAYAACSAIESVHIEKVVGAIAGNDTVFVAMKDAQAAQELCRMGKGIINQ